MFYSREKVICHVEEKSARCRTVLVHTFNPLPCETIAELDARDAEVSRHLRAKGRRRHYSDSVSSRLLGPLCRAAFAVGINHATLLKTGGANITTDMIANITARA